LPDHLIREAEMATALPRLAEAVGVDVMPDLPAEDTTHQVRLSQIYDSRLETLCRDVYPRDYMMFGFTDFDATA
jgi:hypothetical protein